MAPAPRTRHSGSPQEKGASGRRRARVLDAIVRDYVSTHEPVGSRALVERYCLGVSPATIRNDMAALEEKGFLTQPHTSAGRVPTDAGYRSFVDSIDELKPLSAPERRAIERLLDGAADLDDVVTRAVRLLAQITNQVAVVQYPSLQRATLRHLDLIPLGDTRAMLVIITDAGRVEQRTLALARPIDSARLDALGKKLNSRCGGSQLAELAKAFDSIAAELDPAESPTLGPVVVAVARAVIAAVDADSEERVVLAGTANLSRNATDFANTIAPVLDLLEEQVILLKLMAAMNDGVAVSIGHENRHEGLGEASVVAANYDVDGALAGHVGVVGPTRMDYPGAMAAVYAISRYLSDILTGK